MSKPLEPGCKAIVTITAESPENLSRMVRVVEQLPHRVRFEGETIETSGYGPCRLWMCETLGSPLIFRSWGQVRSVPARPFCGLRLQRLDDIPPNEVKELYAPTPLLEESTPAGASHHEKDTVPLAPVAVHRADGVAVRPLAPRARDVCPVCRACDRSPR